MGIRLADEARLVDPVQFALSADLRADCHLSTIHGDLNGYNVLVDAYNECWLIDFANTCQGPLMQDFATFEVFLRVMLVEESNWKSLLAWARSLSGVSDLRISALPSDLAGSDEIDKAHQTVLTVRRLALQEHRAETERSYLIGLLFNALKLMTVMSLGRAQRDHALISAALIAEILRNDISK